MDVYRHIALSIAIWLPIVFGVAILLGGRRYPGLVRPLAAVGALATFLVTVPLWGLFHNDSFAMQFQESVPWIPAFHINYALGIDGISLPLVLLTSLIGVIVVMAAGPAVKDRVPEYFAAFLIMEGLMIGVFSSLDAMLFYVFWEAMLIPMFLIIGIWGGPNRVYATIKFFLYTFLGSVLMLVALLYLYFRAGETFNIISFYHLPLGETPQILIFLAFLIAFAVKIPMWPVHTWLPDAHVEAPTGGSVVLAAIMLKMGAYGFVRFSLPIVPLASHVLAGLMITLSLIAVVYIGLVALMQDDMKKLIAYSSIAHMGFVTLGIFLFNRIAMEGALVQMISHGFVSAALFLCVGVLYDRLHSRAIHDYGGVANRMPIFAAFMMLFAMANSGLPGTSGFVGEFLVILGAFKVNFWYAVLVATSLISGAAYTLWMYKRVIFGPVTKPSVAGLSDVTGRELSFLAVLGVAVLALGLWPAPLLHVMTASVHHLLWRPGVRLAGVTP
ncbi:NADH-quinone oxidoreductase subunit M [Acidiferrobacter sp.]|uniref:NADH-quinone oxidoreductase subunit M n=1 Tax=Acidiferrobacter sp. TaxID=1872107 RepID=UPI00260EEEF1|nr:NADH-quinone oxidoreductase subunit M [Acidiferrobacter sp.]